MKTVIKTRSISKAAVVAASFFALSGIGGTALAQESAAPSATSWSVTYPVGYSDLDVSKHRRRKNTLHAHPLTRQKLLCKSAATWGKKEGEALREQGGQ